MLRLELLRKEKNLSQNALAKKINMTQQRISAYEKGKREPDIETLKQFAEFFQCTIDYITGKSNVRNPEELKNVQFANHGGLNTEGLGEEELKELQRQIDFIKKMKEKK
jgi:transcriptional regulator with XRE-family HTH domain